MDKLETKIVALFLLKRLREAKRQRRWGQKHGLKEVAADVWMHLLGVELEARNSYYAFLENISKKYKVPAFNAKQSLKTAKDLFGC